MIDPVEWTVSISSDGHMIFWRRDEHGAIVIGYDSEKDTDDTSTSPAARTDGEDG